MASLGPQYSGQWTPENYFSVAYDFTAQNHSSELIWLSSRDSSVRNIPEDFFENYIWCVMVSGFNSRIVSDKWPQLKKAWRDFNPYMIDPNGAVEPNEVINNIKKNRAIVEIAQEIRRTGSRYPKTFVPHYLRDHYAMQQLPFIGGVTSQHLARNLGFDFVKPDLHLERLRKHFGFGSAEAMCRAISNSRAEWASMKLALIDFCLFVYMSHQFKPRKSCCGLELLVLR